MPTIALHIDSCLECQHCTQEKVYTADSWDNVLKLTCDAAGDKVINSFYEWHDTIVVPSWCPLLIPDPAK